MEFFKDFGAYVDSSCHARHSSRFEIFVRSYEPRKLTEEIFLFFFFTYP